MEGKRIRQARLASGITLRELSARLVSTGFELTPAALSKYECDRSTPSPRAILALANVLRVDPNYFLSPLTVEIEWLAFRKRATMTKSRQEQVKARASEIVERQVRLHLLLTPDQGPSFPRSDQASVPADAEKLATQLRSQWNLGDGPLDSVTHTIEDHGGIVVELDNDESKFDGLSGWASGTFPVLVTSCDRPVDRKRYNLSHELGHLTMTPDGEHSDKEREDLAHRFAGAFLVPEPTVKREIGSSRRHLNLEELKILKKKYGMSIQAWARRARDLHIIDNSQYTGLCRQISSNGWRTVEPIRLDNDEKPSRMRQLVLRAIAEGILDEGTARSEYSESFSEAGAPAGEEIRPKTALDLLASSDNERDRVLFEAADALSEMYSIGSELREFDAEEVLDQDERASEAGSSQS